MKIVNDKIIWNDEGDKRKGYNLKDGRNLYKTELVKEVTAKAGRVYPKKALRSVKNSGENLIHCSVLRRDCRVDLDVPVILWIQDDT